jgi:hypothetical protein
MSSNTLLIQQMCFHIAADSNHLYLLHFGPFLASDREASPPDNEIIMVADREKWHQNFAGNNQDRVKLDPRAPIMLPYWLLRTVSGEVEHFPQLYAVAPEASLFAGALLASDFFTIVIGKNCSTCDRVQVPIFPSGFQCN